MSLRCCCSSTRKKTDVTDHNVVKGQCVQCCKFKVYIENAIFCEINEWEWYSAYPFNIVPHYVEDMKFHRGPEATGYCGINIYKFYEKWH